MLAESDDGPTGDQEVACSIPAKSGDILPWRLIMKYFENLVRLTGRFDMILIVFADR